MNRTLVAKELLAIARELVAVHPTQQDIREWKQVLEEHPEWANNSVSDPNAVTLQSIAEWNATTRKLEKLLKR